MTLYAKIISSVTVQYRSFLLIAEVQAALRAGADHAMNLARAAMLRRADKYSFLHYFFRIDF
jgi:hypothetical protein